LSDIHSQPQKVKSELESFLGIAPFEQTEIPFKNAAVGLRSRLLKRFLRRIGEVKSSLGLNTSTGLLAWLHHWNEISRSYMDVSPELHREMAEYFHSDNLLLRQVATRCELSRLGKNA